MEGRNLFAEQPKESKGRNLFANQQQIESPPDQQPIEQASQPIEAQNGLPNTNSLPIDSGIDNQKPVAGEQAKSSNMLQDVGNAIAEFAASGNRAAFDALDFMLPDNINAILELSGSDQRVPTFKGKLGSEGGFMEPGAARDVVQGLGQLSPILGGSVPAVGRNLASMGGIAKEALGVGTATALQPVKALQEVASQAFPSKAMTEAKIPLFRGAGEAKAAGFKLDDAGRVVKDAVQQSALKADIPSDTVSFIASSTPQTKKRMSGMMDVLEKGKESRRYRAFNVPQQVIGEAMEDRLSVLQRVNKQAASKLDEVANSLSGQSVDVSAPMDAFKDNLSKQRIKINKNGSLSFKGSSIEGLGPPQKIIRNVYNILNDVIPKLHSCNINYLNTPIFTPNRLKDSEN